MLIYEIEAPALERFARFKAKYPGSKGAQSLEDFMKLDDMVSFSRAGDRKIQVVSTFVNKDSIDTLYANLNSKSIDIVMSA